MNLSQASQTDFIEKQRNGFLHIETFFHQATMAKAAMEGFLNLDFVKMVKRTCTYDRSNCTLRIDKYFYILKFILNAIMIDSLE